MIWIAGLGGCRSKVLAAPVAPAPKPVLATPPPPPPPPLVEEEPTKLTDAWLAGQELKSWNYLQENISPREPKTPGGAIPLKGIVVAALSKKDPDYYFHWVRDSAHVMNVVAEALALKRPYAQPAKVAQQFQDFLKLSRRLQHLPGKWGMGEPRFTVDGKLDTLPWSRPQYDGPALRALAVLQFLRAEAAPRPALSELARQVLVTDLDFVARNWNERGFDIWEEYRAENYHTRLVQLAALEKGAAWLQQHSGNGPQVDRYRQVARKLDKVLDDHWDPARGFLRSQVVIVATDGYTAKKTDLDSAVILAVLDADRDRPAHSVPDDRVQATVAVLEDLFRNTYKINDRDDVGLAYGRYMGDIYYGGNPWYLITAGYAQFYYRLADKLKHGQALPVTAKNLNFLRKSLSPDVFDGLRAGTPLVAGTEAHKRAVADFAQKGDAILRRFAMHTPADGQLYEQFDKTTGQPASSRGIGWSHSAFLTALYARQALGQASR